MRLWILSNLRIPQSDPVPDGSCDFVAIEDLNISLYDIDLNNIDTDIERVTTFILSLIEYADLKFYSEENFIVEALTFVLLTCEIDITSKFQLLYYQIQNDYVPWGFSAPPKKNVLKLDFKAVFVSLIDIFLRLDVNRLVLQCHHCKTKCSCEVVATFLTSNLTEFTLQDLVEQETHNNTVNLAPASIEQSCVTNNKEINAESNVPFNLGNPITALSDSFIVIDIPNVDFPSNLNSPTDIVNDDKVYYETEVATPSVSYNPDVINPHFWKGHNDEGVPIINFDAMFGHTAIDLDLQLDCKV